MERRLIALCLTSAPLAFAAALIALGNSTTHPTWWAAAVKLAVLGGITIMIYGINLFALPFHARRPWKSQLLIVVQVLAGIVGAWMVFVGLGQQQSRVAQIGYLLTAIGGTLFLGNIALLMTQPGPVKLPESRTGTQSRQKQVDKLATGFTMTAGMMVVAGTWLGWILTWWRPTVGRWDLVWGHLMLLGFFYPMASGTSYHTLSRWGKGEWTSVSAVRVHLIAYLISFPLMVIALARDIDGLFAVAGPLMAISMLSWIINIVPVTMSLQPGVKLGIWLALIFIAVGVTLGSVFALDPVMGPRLRGTHVLANLFGFAGLLISGFGNAYVPQLSGHRTVRFGRLVLPQLMLMAIGTGIAAIAFGFRMYGHVGERWVVAPCLIAAAGMALFAIQVAGTFMQDPSIDPGEPIA